MSFGPTARTAFAQLGTCGWRSLLQPRQFRASHMSAPQDMHPAKKLKTTETKKVTQTPLCSVTAVLTQFCVFFRSSVHTTVHSTAMKPWPCTCSGKQRLTRTQVCYVSLLLRSSPLKPLFGRVDPNQRPGNFGYLRYSGRRRGRVR